MESGADQLPPGGGASGRAGDAGDTRDDLPRSLRPGEAAASIAVRAGCCARNGTDGNPSKLMPRRRPRFSGNVLMSSDRPFAPTDRTEAGAWEGDLVRHEALCNRAEVKDLRRCAVAAA